jgi:hypothetical protein
VGLSIVGRRLGEVEGKKKVVWYYSFSSASFLHTFFFPIHSPGIQSCAPFARDY